MTRASPLFSERTEILGELIVLTPLHVGSGDAEPDDAIPVEEGDVATNKPPTSARVQIDARDLPWIPGSSLKGAMRALLGRRPADAAALFGAEPGDDSRVTGALAIFGAPLIRAPSSSWLPLYVKKNAVKLRGVGLSARTAIDHGRGVADRNKLFHAEEVAPETKFRFRACFVEPASDPTRARTALADLLATMRSPDGMTLGRGRGDGAGRVRLEIIKIKRRRIDPTQRRLIDSGNDPELSKGSPISPLGETHEVTLECDGPFFVKDWTFQRPKNSKTEPHVKALRAKNGVPALHATSLMGALRARAEWIVDRDGMSTDGVEVLFGSQDWRGRLHAEEVTCVNSGVSRRPASVRIDRFSGAPMEGALFEIDCVFDPQFSARLRYEAPDVSAKAKAGQAVLDALIEDVTRNGLKLGHASNRGFGWFTVKWERR